MIRAARKVKKLRGRLIVHLFDGWSWKGIDLSADIDGAERRFPVADEAQRQLLPLVPRLRADGRTHDDDPLLRGRRDVPTKVRLLRGSSTAAVRPVVRGTRFCRLSGLPLPPV